MLRSGHVAWASASLLLASLVPACGGETASPLFVAAGASGASGSAGEAGQRASGSGGSAGSGAKGGAAGAGGSAAKGGAAGTGGKGGGGATAGAGGTQPIAGQSGAAGASTAGQGGAAGQNGSCTTGADADGDGDGWTVAQGDCNDCDPAVNPGLFDPVERDAAGQPLPASGQIDQDCSGAPTPSTGSVSCDDDVPLAMSNPLQAARVLGLCGEPVPDMSTPGAPAKPGVIAAAFSEIAGPFLLTAPPSAERIVGQLGALPSFGDYNSPFEGKRLLALSSGYARNGADAANNLPKPACSGGKQWKQGGSYPPGFPKQGTCGTTGNPNDGIAIDLKLRAPANAKSFRFKFRFLSCEYPTFVCGTYNDVFAVLMAPSVFAPGDPMADATNASANVAFESVGDKREVIGVNNTSLLTACKSEPTGKTAPYTSCQDESELAGTTFVDHAASSWIQSRVPVPVFAPGEDRIISLRFAIWDSTDSILDSTTILDAFEWSEEEIATPTSSIIDSPQKSEASLARCNDGLDNDQDGQVDCADAGCRISKPGGGTACLAKETTEETCHDGADNDGNGLVDCKDLGCEDLTTCHEQSCTDGVDDDQDGLTDCNDEDCTNLQACAENCQDGKDNNGNGLVDCDDNTCTLACNESQNCGDGLDNDKNGLTDCQDLASCKGHPACNEDCTDGMDNDKNGQIDCADVACKSNPVCAENCTDGLDNDKDGLIDCADAADCSKACDESQQCFDNVDNDKNGKVDCVDAACAPICGEPAFCGDGLDNDKNGLTDCADPACQDKPECAEICFDGVDNDKDGNLDCNDKDCAGASACNEGSCTDGLDGDADGKIDCADSECFLQAECL